MGAGNVENRKSESFLHCDKHRLKTKQKVLQFPRVSSNDPKGSVFANQALTGSEESACPKPKV